MTELKLPAFAFLDANAGDKDELAGRTVILHVRSASIIEMFDRDEVILNEDVITYKFIYTNKFGIKEKMIAALHYCMTLDIENDREQIINEIIKPCAIWYCDYCTWEDKDD
nr:hypothetical protein [uncultured Bacteroides sp.]